MRPSGKTPLWASIADTLRADIAAGRYRAGDKLPTEAALSARFGVNRHTVRHAVKSLVADGVLRTRRGVGVFVVTTPTEYPIGRRVRFHQNVLANGQDPHKTVLSIESRPATKDEADHLDLQPDDEICIYHGLSLANGAPIAVFSSHFPATRLPGIATALQSESHVTKVLLSCSVPDYTRAATRISARQATATQAMHLHVPEGAPLIYATSLNVDPQGVPVEYGMTWFAGDRVTLTMEPEL